MAETTLENSSSLPCFAPTDLRRASVPTGAHACRDTLFMPNTAVSVIVARIVEETEAHAGGERPE
jgi:hypothetical protein